ncbi:MAG: 23S rRNA (adenine(2503)-C(2))-methyltransferase RlmN [Ruminococcus bromii]|nr:23S rRNA (adenine(2503)-C(2))-methyltransferase RlmN [Ruminococcus bromii]
MGKIDIKSMRLDELQAAFLERGLPKYRAAQVYRWLHQRGVTSFDEMTDLSKDLRAALPETFEIRSTEIALRRVSKLDGTVKYLFSLIDGETVESVLMQYHHGYSICISTQVGCKMGCTFCATGKSGFSRNLTPSEMLSEIQTAQRDAGVRISNVVLMGMGEPLDNYQNVLRFLELVSSENGLNIGMRHISLSTCGLVDRIYDLADKKLQLTLSVSLHAPNDEIRSRTMPVNRKWNVEELLKACRYYSDVTGRRISFEYAMISGVNDSDACAAELASRLRGIISHVNLIPVNDVTGTGYRKSGEDRLRKFSAILEKRGITATVRRTLGSDIEASCGQLRRRNQQGGTL